MSNITLDQLLLIVVSGAMSLAFSYIPKLSDWYNELDATRKRGVMAVVLIVVTAAFFGLACTGWLNGLSERVNIPTVSCDQNGILDLLVAYVLALGANRATYWVAGEKTLRRQKC